MPSPRTSSSASKPRFPARTPRSRTTPAAATTSARRSPRRCSTGAAASINTASSTTCFGTEIGGAIHALSLKTQTPQQRSDPTDRGALHVNRRAPASPRPSDARRRARRPRRSRPERRGGRLEPDPRRDPRRDRRAQSDPLHEGHSRGARVWVLGAHGGRPASARHAVRGGRRATGPTHPPGAVRDLQLAHDSPAVRKRRARWGL